MTILDYAKKYNYSFSEKTFNEVDNLIFSTLVYLDFSEYIKNEKITLKKLAIDYLKNNPKLPKNAPFAYKDAYKLLINIKDSKRFSNVLVYNYVYESDHESQFGAMTYELDNMIYVAFEGTDDLISGWEEDFEMAYHFPVKAHRKATNYLNRYSFSKKAICVGGHSKGGNLALVAAMRSNFLIHMKLVNIYSNDGQGLRKDEIESKKYERIEAKLIHLMPQNAIVGLLFRHKNDIVIKSKSPIFVSHIPSSWKVEDDHFERTELVRVSKVFDKGLSTWLDKYDYHKRERFVKEAFNILHQYNIVSTTQIKGDFISLFKIIKTSKNVSDETKMMVNDLISVMKKMRKEGIETT